MTESDAAAPETAAPPVSALPPPPAHYRWLALVACSLAMAGNYYIYDAINPLEGVFKAQLGFSATMFGWLNSSYSVAAVLTLLAGGYIIDRLGTHRAIFIFAAVCLVGSLVTAAHGSFGTMIAGRVILGLGAESGVVAVTAALAKWFKGKELSFAFGLNLTIARLASVAADRSPGWASFAFYPDGPGGAASWQGPLVVAVAAGGLAVLMAATYWTLEGRTTKRYQLGAAGEADKLEFGKGLRFGKAYWLVVGLCFTFYSGIFPFRTFAIELFKSKLLEPAGGLAAAEAVKVAAHQEAGHLNSLLPLSSMIATPLFGFLVDRIGRRATLMIFGALLLVPVYLILAYAGLSLYVPVVLMGIAFSLIPAVMWPSVAYIVEEKRLGMGYALMTLVQQIGFFALNLGIGQANDAAGAGVKNPAGYAPGMWIFTVLSVAGVLCAVLLFRSERSPTAAGLERVNPTAP